VLETVEQALTMATPTIWNSDQGSHFIMATEIQTLQWADERSLCR
jgi:hypothetical protein